MARDKGVKASRDRPFPRPKLVSTGDHLRERRETLMRRAGIKPGVWLHVTNREYCRQHLNKEVVGDHVLGLYRQGWGWAKRAGRSKLLLSGCLQTRWRRQPRKILEMGNCDVQENSANADRAWDEKHRVSMQSGSTAGKRKLERRGCIP